MSESVLFLGNRQVRFASVALACLIAGLIGCGGSSTHPSTPAEEVGDLGPSWFEDATDAWGLNFTHDPGPIGTYFMPQSMGSGVAAFDANGDGLLDVYLLTFGGPESKSVNRLFLQSAPGKFQDATAGSGLGVAGHNHGVAIGDVNNDGKPDVLLSQYRGIRLFMNLGGGKFADATAGSGLVNLSWGMSSAFLDYDRDGWLDLVVTNYLDYDPKVECRSPEGTIDFCGPNKFSGTRSKLFRNLGGKRAESGKAPHAAFEDVSFASGIGRVPGPGLGVATADFNGDGWVDIFVANDGQPNRLWVNQKDGTFSDQAVSRGVAYTAMGKAYAGMGIAVGDVNGDGLTDLYVTHLGSETHTLWKQEPRGQFRDRTVDAGLTSTRWRGTGFGTLMADFNNDGGPDIAIVNGRVFRGGPATEPSLGFWETYAEKNQLLANDGTGTFRDISGGNRAFCDVWNVGRGLVSADFDNDGAVDLLVAPIGTRARIYRNIATERGNWFKLQVVDPALHRDVYGAEVRVRAGGKVHVKVLNPAESYLSSNPPLLHFGLGKTETVESIEVTWPVGDKGVREIFPGGPANKSVTLIRGQGRAP